VQYDGGGTGKRYSGSADLFTDSIWQHFAITHDGTNIDLYMNGDRVSNDDGSVDIDSNVDAGNVYLGGHPSNPFGSTDFTGTMDDTRFSNYERQAFAGGLMISAVTPGTNTISIYNSGDTSYDFNGIELWKDGSQCGSEITAGSLASGATRTTTTCSIGVDDAVALVDVDGDNNNADEGAGSKEWIIDGVCWNDDGSTIDTDCNDSTDAMIAAGVWGEDTAADMSEGPVTTITLLTDGNNDEAVDDWYVPEFGTLLMPVASVLMIVGYNYRRREQLES